MDTNDKICLVEILHKYEQELLAEWMADQLSAPTLRRDLMKEAELHEQSRQFLNALRVAVQQGSLTDITTADWREIREILTGLSHSRAQQGFTIAETATFILSFKQPLFIRLQKELQQQAPGAGGGDLDQHCAH